MPDLPDIRMRPSDAQVIGGILGTCDPHGQDIFRFLMENWEASGYYVEASTTGIALSFPLDDHSYALAALHPGFADRKQEIILGWEGLRKKVVFSESSILKFQSEIGKLIKVKTTANTAHIEITGEFNQQKAEALLSIMDHFAQAGILNAKKLDWIEWDSRLPKLTFEGDPLVKLNVRETFLNLEPRIQEIFAFLIQGWMDSGGEIECLQPGRIYLKFITGEHEYGRYGILSHRFNLAVLSTSGSGVPPVIELAWNLSSGSYAYLEFVADEVKNYEEIISQLPGFQREGSQPTVVIDGTFKKDHAAQLLDAMLDLKLAAGS